MRLKLMALTAAAAVLSSAAAASAAVVSADLNLRSGPGTGYGVVAVMPAGADVRVIGCSGAWCRVAWGGTRGFASRDYLERASGPVYAAPPPAVYVEPEPLYVGPPRPYWRNYGPGYRPWRHNWRRW